MTNTEATIRAFAPDDWGALCALYEPAARCELALSGTDPRAFRPMSEEEELDEFQQLNTAMVACVVDRVAGFVAWRNRGEWRGSGYLSWLFVDPAFHRRGFGNRLMVAAMAAPGDQAWTLAKLGNDPAINLYVKHGMQIVRSRPAHSGGFPHTELRLALPTSRKSDPDVPNFGV